VARSRWVVARVPLERLWEVAWVVSAHLPPVVAHLRLRPRGPQRAERRPLRLQVRRPQPPRLLRRKTGWQMLQRQARHAPL
jgi:hypothetical protein